MIYGNHNIFKRIKNMYIKITIIFMMNITKEGGFISWNRAY